MERLNNIQLRILAERSPENPRNKTDFWSRVSKITVTELTDPYLLNHLNNLNISALVIFKG